MAAQYITVDPNERFKTEFQKAFTDKNLKRLLQKTSASDHIDLSDQLAVRDKDFMDYTAMLNAHDSAPVRDFVDRTIQPNASIRTPGPISTKFNNLYADMQENSGAENENPTRNGSPFVKTYQTYNLKS